MWRRFSPEGAAAVDLDDDLAGGRLIVAVMVMDGVGLAVELELDFLGFPKIVAKAGGDVW